jgi:hypothetical protein
MNETLKRSTVYFEPQIHSALRIMAAHSHCSMSDIVNDAVKLVLAEDQEDVAACEERANEPVLSHEEFLNQLKADGKI